MAKAAAGGRRGAAALHGEAAIARSATARTAALEAFDRESAHYDVAFGRNPAGLVFRHVFQEHLRRLFPPGSRVLDLGCGTGADALFLAGTGVTVHAVDPAAGMIATARTKARALGVPETSVRFERRPAEDPWDGEGEPFDGACSDFGALNCADLTAVGVALARALRPGAPVLLSLVNPRPLPALMRRALRGGSDPRGVAPRVAGVPVPASYPAAVRVRKALGRAFEWRGGFALGVLMPGPGHRAWAERHPQAFGLLAALEGLVRGWPGLRGLGDHVVLEGIRR